MRTRTKTLGGALVLGLLLGLQGCGSGSEDKTAVATKLVVNSPAAIAQESADDYDDNVNGVISGATLKRWIDDWPANRPAGISGKLVILQVTAGPAGFEYLKSNGTNVFTYLEGGWTQVRTNGVIETIQMVLDGSGVDALLKKYNIDPRNDMIVCAQGTASAGNVMAQGRCWYTLRYWGVDKANLALLNGSNQWNGSGGALQPAASYFQAAANTAPNSGTISVKQLSVDNTQLQATMADMLKILPSSDLNQRTDGVFIWDARDAGQFSAGEYLEGGSANAANCTSLTAGVPYCTANVSFNYMSTFQNSGARQGHPWGALQLNYVPEGRRKVHYFSAPREVRVNCNLAKGRLPYVYTMYRRYSCKWLKSRPDLKGKRFFVRIDPDDLSHVLLVDDNDAEVCVLRAEGQWGLFTHNQQILRIYARHKHRALNGRRAYEAPIHLVLQRMTEAAPNDADTAQDLAYVIDYFRRCVSPEAQAKLGMSNIPALPSPDEATQIVVPSSRPAIVPVSPPRASAPKPTARPSGRRSPTTSFAIPRRFA